MTRKGVLSALSRNNSDGSKQISMIFDTNYSVILIIELLMYQHEIPLYLSNSNNNSNKCKINNNDNYMTTTNFRHVSAKEWPISSL